MKVSGIYALINKVNGKVYVGQSVDIYTRFRQHKSVYKKTMPISLSIKKYGWDNFHKIVLEYIDIDVLRIEEARKTLNDRENFWINYIDKLGLRKYNIRPSAESNLGVRHSDATNKANSARLIGNSYSKGYIHTEETKEKMSLARMGNKNALGNKLTDEQKRKIGLASKGNKHRLGHKHSPETIEKMIKSRTGRKFSEESKKKISESAKGRIISPEQREKISAGLKAYFIKIKNNRTEI